MYKAWLTLTFISPLQFLGTPVCISSLTDPKNVACGDVMKVSLNCQNLCENKSSFWLYCTKC